MWLVRQVAGRSRGSDWRSYFLIVCVTVLALLLAGASWSALSSAKERTAAENRQGHTLRVLRETDRLRAATLQMVRGERGYLLTGERRFLEPYMDGSRQQGSSLARLEELTAGSRAQRVKVEQLRIEVAHLGQVFEAMIEQQKSGRHAEAIYYMQRGSDRDAIDSMLRELADIEATERGYLAERTALATTRARSNERYQYILAAIGLLLLGLSIIATVYVRRALTAEAEAKRELQRIATTDSLTDLPNRRSFMDALGRRLARAEADDRKSFCLAIYDIDHFKRINDRFGHPAGDAVIREVADRSSSALRKRDLIGRIGGEEFAVILPAATIDQANEACERMRAALAARPIRHGDAIIPFTTSVGIAEFRRGDDLDHLMARADAALYEAKTGGRNQIRLAA